MGFLSPWFLAGLAAVGLPVWFHLLKKHKSTPRPFSSLMFFEKRVQSSVKHRRLQYLLLFALRTALVVMLALTFAGPFVMGDPAPGGGRRMTVLAIDDSFSMRQGGRLDRAKAGALEVLSGLRGGDQAQVVAFGGEVRALSQPTDDPASLRTTIEAIEPTDSRGSYGDLVRALRSLAQSSRFPLEVHLFSDMQKSSLPPGFMDLQLPRDTRLVVHRAAEAMLPNWTVESVNAPKRIHDPGKTRIQATIAGLGTETAVRRVSLVMNGKVLETRDVEIPAGGRVTVEFLSLDASHGLNRAEVRVDSGDAFPQDDRFLFSVERADQRPVLFVHEARDTRSPLYFRAALEASSRSAFTLDALTAGRSAGTDLDRYAFVVLSDVVSAPRSFEDALAKYVRAGGSLLVALGPAAAALGKVPLFDAAILESRYSSRRGERFQTLASFDPAHPSLRRANRWDGVKFYQVVHVANLETRILARVTDQTPVLHETQAGSGRVLLFASTFDNVSNDFPLHASFVPFVEQTARYLGGLEERPGNFVAGSYLELRKTGEQSATVEVTDPEGRRVLSLSESSSTQGLSLWQEGFYQVRWSNGQQELAAVNADRRESDLEVIPEETLSLWENTGEGAAATPGNSELQPKPRGLWWHAMLAVLMLALAESIVAGRYLDTRSEAA